jgi:hypothetical protein
LHSSKPARANSSQEPILKQPSLKRAGGVAQGVGLEFKPQYCKEREKSRLKFKLANLVFWLTDFPACISCKKGGSKGKTQSPWVQGFLIILPLAFLPLFLQRMAELLRKSGCGARHGGSCL